MIIAYIPLLFAIIGVLIFCFSKHPDVKHIGDVLFWAGWLVTMLGLAKQVFRLG